MRLLNLQQNVSTFIQPAKMLKQFQHDRRKQMSDFIITSFLIFTFLPETDNC